MKQELFRLLPAVDEVLAKMEESPWGREMVREAVRQTLTDLRQQLKAGWEPQNPDFLKLAVEKSQEFLLLQTQPNLRRVLNATGVILHTNLGRAVLADSAIQAVQRAASGYCNLEFDLAAGQRGTRYSLVEELLQKLTGAEAALVVNNNAAAVFLALNTLGKDREVIVSRGQLVEIGGSFRIPEIMEQSSCHLVEVGTTNKTHPQDYRAAINANTALLLHVHMSNYRIIGFHRDIEIEEIVQIGREHEIPVMSDLGSGFLINMEPFGLPAEPTVQQVLQAGADVVTFSGDKLLGGSQAGIIVGRRDLVAAMQKNPLNRALRIDKLTLAALEATLREYLDKEQALQNVPVLRMLKTDPAELQSRADSLQQVLSRKLAGKAHITLESGFSLVGGGAMPTAQLPSTLIGIQPLELAVDSLAEKLRLGRPAVLGVVR
ncbi:MAG: L-seryl-tRNA(Sec) selenium transferase, partial [Clostridia bacterium]|nr:L-seryl-tRNA(Sec) selenium transferase [Clostridia bacterium]